MLLSSSLKKVFFFFIIFFCINNSFAQFNIVSTFPANGDVNVDTAATLSITFNSAIDTNAIFNFPDSMFVSLFFIPDTLVHEPDSITLSPDLKTVYFHNLHLSEFILYRFCIFKALNISGDSLEIPYSFSFATSSIVPNYYASLSGTINYPSGDPSGALVVSFDSNPFEQNESEIKAWAVVNDASGMFTMDFVDSGFCWLVAINDFNLDDDGDIEIIDGSKIGYNDFDLNLRPDSNYIFIGSTVSGLNMTLIDVYSQTARSSYPDLEVLSQNWAPDAYLSELGTGEFRLNGTSIFWQYAFFSPFLSQSKIWMTAGDLIVSIKPDSVEHDTLEIPSNWLDSDTIMAIAENNGGFEYRQQYPDVEIYGSCGYFNPQFDKYSKYFKTNNSMLKQKMDIKTAVWSIEYDSDLALESLFFLIDAVDGTILNFPVTAANAEQKALQLAQNWSLDVALLNIANQWTPVDTSGTSELWSCIYYSPQKDSLYAITLWGLLPFYSGPAGIIPIDTIIISPGWLDSDVAIDSSEYHGGSDYRQNNIQIHVNATLGKWDNGAYPDSIVWRLEYTSSTANPLVNFIDAYSGDFIDGIENPNNANIPNTFVLEQNFPNPFNPITTIGFNLPKSVEVKIKIYNLTGQEVGFISKAKMSAGSHKVIWNAKNLPSGVYFYKIYAGEYSDIKKCILLK